MYQIQTSLKKSKDHFSNSLLFIPLLNFLVLTSCEGVGPLSQFGFDARCAPQTQGVITGSFGSANVFLPDPFTTSGLSREILLSASDPDATESSGCLSCGTLSVKNASHKERRRGNAKVNLSVMDRFTSQVTLSRLSGEGVLTGKYIKVINRLQCRNGFGAYDAKNNFRYPHHDFRFQEAMAYFYADLYQASLDEIGYLKSGPDPIIVSAHCEKGDNAYFARQVGANGKSQRLVCLGDSALSEGGFYADDAQVILHELQHAATGDHYSPTQNLNQLWYDEAGVLNEAISDFMAMAFTEPLVESSSHGETKIFSQWALGQFDPVRSRTRGAHRCPSYDPSYPLCKRFPAFNADGTISYHYPDGMGWPYSSGLSTRAHVYDAVDSYQNYGSQEDPHHADVLMLGALWDIYEEIKFAHRHAGFARKITTQLILDSLGHMPQPNTLTSHSPVTLIGFAATLLRSASELQELTSIDRSLIKRVLVSRGLFEPRLIANKDWMGVGDGTNILIRSPSASPGVFILDDPVVLKQWLRQMGSDPSIVADSSVAPHWLLDPGDVAAIWFDIENTSDLTAGGVLLTVTSKDSDVQILGSHVNIGYMVDSGLNQTQVMYGKINGLSVVHSLNPGEILDPALPGNTYFKTNPHFNKMFRTAVWIKIDPLTAHQKRVDLEVTATPSNGVSSTQNFSVVIQ